MVFRITELYSVFAATFQRVHYKGDLQDLTLNDNPVVEYLQNLHKELAHFFSVFSFLDSGYCSSPEDDRHKLFFF